MNDTLARSLSDLLTRLEPKSSGTPALEKAVAALFAALEEGHVCLDQDIAGELAGWLPELKKLSSVVGGPGEFRPLIIDGGRLYFARYWKYESDVAAALKKRAVPIEPPPDVKLLMNRLPEIIGGAAFDRGQATAILGAAMRNLAIIAGGPGTGKTTTVATILALRQMLCAKGSPLSIALAAPTGKAADRLRGSIAKAKQTLRLPDETKALIPEEASTIHRLLGMNPVTGLPKRNRSNPLSIDLLILDEASMIDLSLLAKVLDALPPRAGLILLGDKDQLDAVQPGSVFGELCRSMGESVFTLTKSYRFDDASGIGLLSKAINDGDADRAIGILRSDTSGQLVWHDTTDTAGLEEAVFKWLAPYFRLVEENATEAECFTAFDRLRVLTPLRDGPNNVNEMNDQILAWLRNEGIAVRHGDWYPGRPVMVNTNNYSLGLFNGDVGITLNDRKQGMAVAFPGPESSWRRFATARVPSFEPAYACTVHKSQGSEFESVLLLIPPGENPVVNRNLLYTGITRAKSRCEIWGTEASLRAAVARKPVRAGGLGSR